MQLVEEGKLDLSAPVSKYLDGLPAGWQPVTIRQLLTHVSGLPDVIRVLDPETRGIPNGQNEEAVWAKLKEVPMDFETGTLDELGSSGSWPAVTESPRAMSSTLRAMRPTWSWL